MLHLLKSVDDDKVCCVTGVEKSTNSHHCWDLSCGDADGGSGHEGADSRERNHINNPAHANEADEDNDTSTDDGQSRGNNMSFDLGIGILCP